MKKDELIKIVKAIKIDQDELAYLALTSKVEHPLRDRIAWKVHFDFQETDLVCREYNNGLKGRIDLALLDFRNNPKTLIEFKAHSSIDNPTFLRKGIKKDIIDMKSFAKSTKSDPEMYFIYFNNIIESTSFPITPRNLDTSIKYYDQINKGEDIIKDYKDKVIQVVQNWKKLLSPLNIPAGLTTAVEIKAGSYYNIPVSIWAFIYGPFKKHEVITINGDTNTINNFKAIKPDLNVSDDIIFDIEDADLKDILINTQSGNQSQIKTESTEVEYKQRTHREPNKPSTEDIENFTHDLKKLGVGNIVLFPANHQRKNDNPKMIIGKIERLFLNNNTDKEEATIKGEDGKTYFRYQYEINKLREK